MELVLGSVEVSVVSACRAACIPQLCGPFCRRYSSCLRTCAYQHCPNPLGLGHLRVWAAVEDTEVETGDMQELEAAEICEIDVLVVTTVWVTGAATGYL